MKSLLKRKPILLLASVALVLTMAVGGTLAYLIATTLPVVNTFTPADVSVKIEEDFKDPTVKKDVCFTNTGSAKAYIRAAVIVTWQDQNGHVLPIQPSDYTINWSKEEWSGPTNGFYYYNNAVEPNGKTGILFTDCQVADGVTPPEGYNLHVEVLSQAIQAEPITTVQSVWGWTPSSSSSGS